MGPQDPPRRLGRGLDALLAKREPRKDAQEGDRSPTNNAVLPETGEQSALRTLPLSQIRPNPYQPRKEFRPDELADLENSLRSSGLLQPITVRPAPNGQGFELIAGERRFRAATRLGWKEIPAIVRETDERTLLTLAMIENLQRADLDPIEEADGYQRLIDEFAASQQEVADAVGKERSTVANALRLLQLPASIRRLLQEKQLTAGHARALLSLASERAMTDLAREAVASGMSVREIERRVKAAREGGKSASPATPPRNAVVPRGNAAEVRRIEELLKRKFQTPASIHMESKERGEVRLTFFSADDLERLLQTLGVNLED